jgi:hypothetical protein
MIKLFSSNRFPSFWPPSAPGAACPFSLIRKILLRRHEGRSFLAALQPGPTFLFHRQKIGVFVVIYKNGKNAKYVWDKRN